MKALRTVLLLVFVAVPVINFWPFPEGSPGERFARETQTLVDPAGWAFAIWGVIFTGMLLFAFFQLRNERKTPELRRAYWGLIFAGLASIAFVPIARTGDKLWGAFNLYWHLVALLYAYVALRQQVRNHGLPFKGWTYFAPSLYLGWISAATVISTALLLDDLGVRFGQEDVELLVATILYAVLFGLGLHLLRRADAFYAGTVAWALFGIAVEQWGRGMNLAGAVAGGEAVMLLVAIGMRVRRGLFYAR